MSKNWELPASYDIWRTNDDREQVSAETVNTVFITNYGIQINVELEFWWSKKRGYIDMKQTRYFHNGEKLDFDHPLLTKYVSELDDQREEIINNFKG